MKRACSFLLSLIKAKTEIITYNLQKDWERIQRSKKKQVLTSFNRATWA